MRLNFRAMDKSVYIPDYAYDAAPDHGEIVEVANGVNWLRMPLPFKLDHINLWLLDDSDEDSEGWAIVDTGIARDEVKAAWEIIIDSHFTNGKIQTVAGAKNQLAPICDRV